MKTKFLTLCLFLFIFSSCQKIEKLNRVVVNAIHLKDVNLTDKDIITGNVLNYYYTNNTLYLSDNVHKKIFALNTYNRVIFELGNIFDTSTQSQNQSQVWEGMLENLQTEFNDQEESKTSVAKIESEKSTTNSQALRVNYQFQDIGQIGVDNIGNIYVSHFFKQPNSADQNMEILKFSSTGQFLYRIGEEGRDNPAFRSDIKIQNFYFDNDNGFWVKYLQSGKMGIRYYSGFGKNILYFSENQIVPLIDGYLDQENNKNKYMIEDIFPINNSRNIMVILDVYGEVEGQLQIQKKQLLTLDKRYVLEDITSIKNMNMQIEGMTNQNELYGLSYKEKQGYLLEVYNHSGNIIAKSKINPDIQYYNRIMLGVNPEGNLLGMYLKSKDLIFVTWRS